MTTTDTDGLKERLFDALQEARWVDSYDITSVVLPIVAAEVRKAKAEALREAADSVHDNAASPYCLPCHRDDADLLHTIAAEYETGASDEYR